MKPKVNADALALSLIKKLYAEKRALESKDARKVTERDYKAWQRLKELERIIH